MRNGNFLTYSFRPTLSRAVNKLRLPLFLAQEFAGGWGGVRERERGTIKTVFVPLLIRYTSVKTTEKLGNIARKHHCQTISNQYLFFYLETLIARVVNWSPTFKKVQVCLQSFISGRILLQNR